MKIVIAGAGIGGLATAIGLARQGHDVRVFERADAPRAVGAGISLQPNAMQALGVLGLDEKVRRRGSEALDGLLRHSSGHLIQRLNFEPYLRTYGFLPQTIHRATLLELLLDEAQSAGASVEFGQVVDGIHQNESSVHVSTNSGTIRCDGLIGADGIHSVVRACLLGKQPVRYSGYVCWRGVVTDQDLGSSQTMNEIWGNKSRFGFMPCGDSKVYWFATLSTDRKHITDDWHVRFQDWPEPVGQLIQRAPINQIAFNEIIDRPPTSCWGSGRIRLLGDAAHAMTPNFGQGGAQALEDAVVLALAFEKSGDPEDAFRRYECSRHTRTRTLVNASWKYGKIAQGGNVFNRFVRNVILPRIPDALVQKELDWQFDFHKEIESFENQALNDR